MGFMYKETTSVYLPIFRDAAAVSILLSDTISDCDSGGLSKLLCPKKYVIDMRLNKVYNGLTY